VVLQELTEYMLKYPAETNVKHFVLIFIESPISFGIKQKYLSSGRSLLLYMFKRRGIKL
jgi:hypothetical protein